MKGKGGIARAAYVTATGKEGDMSRKFIPARDTIADWRKNPEFIVAYDALEEEFALAEALIKARAQADLTQVQVAERMGTTQAVIARLESGRSMPSTRTLKRFAEATGTRLTIAFDKSPKKAVRIPR